MDNTNEMDVFTRSLYNIPPMAAAFAVASLEQAELRLKHFNIEFHKFLVPGTNASQIFLYDPEGCVSTSITSKFFTHSRDAFLLATLGCL